MYLLCHSCNRISRQYSATHCKTQYIYIYIYIYICVYIYCAIYICIYIYIYCATAATEFQRDEPQCTATRSKHIYINILRHSCNRILKSQILLRLWRAAVGQVQHTATHCNTLQHTATHTLQPTATHTLQPTATHCNALHHTVLYCNILQLTSRHCHTLPLRFCGGGVVQNIAVHYSALRCVALCCSALRCVAVCCSVTPPHPAPPHLCRLWCAAVGQMCPVAVCCIVLHCVTPIAVCCIVLHCVTLCCSVL